MVDDSILKKVLQNLGNIAEETGKEAIKQSGEIGHDIISGKQLLGDITQMSDNEYKKKKAEDEAKSQKEAEQLKAQMTGRDVQGEMKQLEDEEERNKKQDEQRMLQEIRLKRDQERREHEAAMAAEAESSGKRPGKEKRKGGAFAHKKKSDVNASMSTATGEFSGGKID